MHDNNIIMIVISHFIFPVSHTCPLISTDVIADEIIDATVDKDLPALVKHPPRRVGIPLHPVTQELKKHTNNCHKWIGIL